MLGSDNKEPRNKAGITLVANNCEVVGDMHFTDELHVDGVVKGNIVAAPGSKAKVTVSEQGCVEGEIRVPTIVVNGEVSGDIHADKHIELAAKARIRGSVFYNLIEMVLGARVDGKLVHVDEASKGERVEGLTVASRVEPGEPTEATQSVAQPAARG